MNEGNGKTEEEETSDENNIIIPNRKILTGNENKEKNTKSIVFVKRSCESNDHNYVKKAPKKWWKNDMILNVIFLKFSKIRKIKKKCKK